MLGRTTAEDIVDPKTSDTVIAERRAARRGDGRQRSRRSASQGVHIRSSLICDIKQGVCAQVLRPRSRPRHAGQHRRGGRRHRRPVDRRAGHPADDADLPHRRRGAAGAEQSNVEAAVDGTIEFAQHADDRQSAAAAPVVMSRNGEIAGPTTWAGASARAPRALRRQAAVRGRRNVKPRRTHRRVGSLHSARSSPRSDGTVKYQRPDRGPVDDRADRRERPASPQRVVTDWKQQPRGTDLKPRITLRDENGEVIRCRTARKRGTCLSADAIFSVENGAAGAGRRRAGPHPAGSREDSRHHRRSAARGGAVRGAQAEGVCDHRRDRRPRGVRQGLQGQAPHRRSFRTMDGRSRASI